MSTYLVFQLSDAVIHGQQVSVPHEVHRGHLNVGPLCDGDAFDQHIHRGHQHDAVLTDGHQHAAIANQSHVCDPTFMELTLTCVQVDKVLERCL